MTTSPWKISDLISKFEESATLAIGAKAKKMAAEGKSIVNFGVGEPDFNTPAAIVEAANSAAKSGLTKYTAVGGLPSLRKSIAETMSADYGVRFLPEEVIVSCGGKQAIFHFLQSTINPGDEVLILAPYWVSFPEMVKIVGGKPVVVRGREGRRISAADIEAKITPRTRCLILNSPSNPSGLVFTEEELRSILKVIEPHPIWLLSDDTYYKLVYGETRWVSALKLDESFRKRSCIVGSASKTYSMTGWRIGWALAPREVINAMTKIQSQVTSNPCSISQAAVEAALLKCSTVAEEFRVEFDRRRKLMLEGLKKIRGFQMEEPKGAFYFFVNTKEALHGSDTTAYAEFLLEKHGVCVIPGEGFGEPDFIRLSYALSENDIREGLRRIEESLKSFTERK